MKFIFDENLPHGFAEGLRHFGEDVEHVLDHFPQGTTDVEVLEFVGKNDFFLVTRDIRIRYNKAEKEALQQHGVGAFFLVGKQMSKWEIIKQLVRSWESIKELAEKENRPFIFSLRRSGKPKRIL